MLIRHDEGTSHSPVRELASLLSRAPQLQQHLASALQDGGVPAADLPAVIAAIDRLTSSVVRPLEVAVQSIGHAETDSAPPSDSNGGAPLQTLRGAPLWDLAQDVTRFRLRAGLPNEVTEATAAL